MKPAFLINRESHTVKKNGSVLAHVPQDLVTFTAYIDDFSRLESVLKQAAAARCDSVFIEGGDGTIHGVLSALMHVQNVFNPLPIIILLPGGMTNLVAKQVGIHKPTPAKVKAVIEGRGRLLRHRLPMLEVDTGQVYYGFLFSTGALPNGTRYCLEYIHTKGIEGSRAVLATVYQILVGRTGLRQKILTPSPFSLLTDDHNFAGEHLISLASTLPYPLSGFHVFWGGKPECNKLRLTYARSDAKAIIRHVIGLMRKEKPPKAIRKLSQDGFISLECQRAIIHHEGPIVLDGEFLANTNGTITLSVTDPLEFTGMK